MLDRGVECASSIFDLARIVQNGQRTSAPRNRDLRVYTCSALRSVLIACALLPVSALSQETTTSSQRQNENTIEGTVVSSTRDTLVVKTEDNQFQLFTFDRDTVKPRSLPANARVRVVSTPGEEAGGPACKHRQHIRSATDCTGDCVCSGTANSTGGPGPGARY